MKKIRKYEEGGDIESTQGQSPGVDDDIRARAKAYVAGTLQDETGKESKIRRNTETGDLYTTEDSKAKPTPKAKSFKTKAKEAGFTSAETKGGAALMTRKDRGSSYTPPAKSTPRKASRSSESSGTSDIIGAKKGGLMGSASKRADGCAMRGKTKGRMV
jgi:hypothetical protein